MAISRIKATYSLDTETMRVLERMAKRWGVSKSEALRRAIRASGSLTGQTDSRSAILDELQTAAALSPTAATRWQREVRAERQAHRGGKRSAS